MSTFTIHFRQLSHLLPSLIRGHITLKTHLNNFPIYCVTVEIIHHHPESKANHVCWRLLMRVIHLTFAVNANAPTNCKRMNCRLSHQTHGHGQMTLSIAHGFCLSAIPILVLELYKFAHSAAPMLTGSGVTVCTHCTLIARCSSSSSVVQRTVVHAPLFPFVCVYVCCVLANATVDGYVELCVQSNHFECIRYSNLLTYLSTNFVYVKKYRTRYDD